MKFLGLKEYGSNGQNFWKSIKSEEWKSRKTMLLHGLSQNTEMKLKDAKMKSLGYNLMAEKLKLRLHDYFEIIIYKCKGNQSRRMVLIVYYQHQIKVLNRKLSVLMTQTILMLYNARIHQKLNLCLVIINWLSETSQELVLRVQVRVWRRQQQDLHFPNKVREALKTSLDHFNLISIPCLKLYNHLNQLMVIFHLCNTRIPDLQDIVLFRQILISEKTQNQNFHLEIRSRIKARKEDGDAIQSFQVMAIFRRQLMKT